VIIVLSRADRPGSLSYLVHKVLDRPRGGESRRAVSAMIRPRRVNAAAYFGKIKPGHDENG
jgi:hypothetical protein